MYDVVRARLCDVNANSICLVVLMTLLALSGVRGLPSFKKRQFF
jgi:hypothetical protein